MPRFDGRGPEGLGPRTGRGLGDCAATENMVKSVNEPKQPTASGTFRRGLALRRGLGFGRRVGRGLGRGFGRGFGRRY